MDEPKKIRFTKKKDAPSNTGYVDGRLGQLTKEFPVGDRTLADGVKREMFTYPNNPQSLPVEPTHFLDWYGGRPNATVNAMELLAMKKAFDFILEAEPVQVCIIADSQLTLKTLLRDFYTWEARGGIKSDGAPAKNWELWVETIAVYRAVQAKNIDVRFAWVNSHTGDPGNEKADYNANKGMILELRASGEDRYITKVPKEYTVKTKLNCRLMEQRWWYGLCDRKSSDYGIDGKHVYFFGNHGKAEEEEDLIGKNTATSKISVLVTSEPEPVLDLLATKLEKRYYRGVSEVTLGYLENILKTERYAAFLEEGEDILYPVPDKPLLISPDKVPILKTLQPAYHGFTLVEHLSAHVRLIEQYLRGDDALVLTDLTDLVYRQLEEKSKVVYKTQPQIDPPNNTVTFPLNYCVDLKTVETRNVKLKMGADIPTRNTLAAVSGPSTKVWGVTYREAATAFRYFTLIETEEGLLLTASLKSNQIILLGKRV
jgi:ribonuclease HI